ncbi:unnamed protein product [Schistosoma margrebowiei]|uniref:Uncharacterized protein n=1 Tax=Schistosoma margrebowiei TaxID=48269 RepID=A0A183N6S3_9TREM|nr:unnamed protein product [Schistosoma margrebowiei]
MNIIQCYAPTNDSNDDIKDQFYERLQSVIEKCPRKDLTILMGDLNVKVRIDNTGSEDIMGRHGLGERNENGERIAQHFYTSVYTRLHGSQRTTLQRTR